MKFLIISPSPELPQKLASAAPPADWEFVHASKAAEALGALKSQKYAAVIFDTAVTDLPSERLVKKILQREPGIILVAVAPAGELSLFQQGLFFQSVEAFPKEGSGEELVALLEESLKIQTILAASGIVGQSRTLKKVALEILAVGPTDLTVLITGESGSGKELVAKAIAESSPRTGKPFLAVNCGAFAEGVLESELFGHERGAFTGAVARKEGVFEQASGGTIFLDEIGEISPATQVKLLRVLEEKAFFRVGGKEQIKVDVRVLAATNRDLSTAVAEGRFRADLYYRLGVVKIELPPLRQRPEDIPLLVFHFLKQLKESNPQLKTEISEGALEELSRALWPGNVRELKNFIESRALLSSNRTITTEEVREHLSRASAADRKLPVATGKTVETAERELIFQALVQLSKEVRELKELLLARGSTPTQWRYERPAPGEISPENPARAWPDEASAGTPTLEEMEKETIRQALREVEGNRKKAAEILGIGERTLYRKIDLYGLRKGR
ncbi:MAG: sigma-54 dependent transcriptional regulator [candidate division Zixibacteria bacterium]|nr:sigma-54 dependent transcriptional regulator [candidate division Zixibacteria bacterium]